MARKPVSKRTVKTIAAKKPTLLKLPKAPWSKDLARLLPEAFSLTQGRPVLLSPGLETGYAVALEEDGLHIAYNGIDDLMLALGDTLAGTLPADGAKDLPYDFRGIMLDVSRNAVARADFLKDRIAQLSLLGLNRFCLYSEDVYPVPGEPLFGYARGRYSSADIKDLVKHAGRFGVEMFPCIQTLGHMEHILKYPHYNPLKDNDYVYNVYAKDLYAFIEKTIDAAVEPYDTKVIHIGMDETFGMGRGLAFKENEGINPRALYVEHVRRVVEICRSKGLQPVMWGDIVLGHGGEQAMGGDEASRLPKDVVMNYWQYAWCDAKKYDGDLADFKSLGYAPYVSPGAWCWSRFFPAYYKAEANIASLLEAGKRAGVRGALNTHWGDDGHECFFDYNLPAHAYFLAQCTERDGVLSTAKSRFQAVFGEDFDAVRSTEKIDLAGTKPEALIPANIGKCFFYDDPAQGLFSGLPFVKPAGDFYAKTAKEMGALAKRKSLFQPLFAFAESFCDFLAVKSDLRRKAVAAYRKNDKRALKAVMGDITKAETRLEKVRVLYRAYWLKERSPFGLEIVDGRMGILAARLDYLRHILTEHLAGRMARLEELEFAHFSMFHESRSPDYQPAIWPEFMLHYSALASRNTIKWW
jgi:hexosaminidase